MQATAGNRAALAARPTRLPGLVWHIRDPPKFKLTRALPASSHVAGGVSEAAPNRRVSSARATFNRPLLLTRPFRPGTRSTEFCSASLRRRDKRCSGRCASGRGEMRSVERGQPPSLQRWAPLLPHLTSV